MFSPLKIPSQLQRQRHQRHIKLMKMIDSYELTKQQQTKLQKIKSHTMMEINLRFLRSQINRNYKFPKFTKTLENLNQLQDKSSFMTDNDQEEDRILKQQLEYTQNPKGKGKKTRKNKQFFMYDLRNQNLDKQIKQIKNVEIKTYSNKVLSLEQSRRVHSLGNEKSLQKQKDDFIIKRHNPIMNPNERYSKSPQSIVQSKSLKTIKPISLTRRSSKQNLILSSSIHKFSPLGIDSKKIIVQNRKLKLPEINSNLSNQAKSLRRLNPMNEKLKTEKYYQEEDIQYAIGKKLVTQTDSGKKVIKGVQKYLKQLQAQKKQSNLNHQPGKLMKKDKDHQKRKGNIQVFKSVKHSLKRQIQ